MKRFSLALLMILPFAYLAYAPPPDPPGGQAGTTNNGGNVNGAPIDGGLGILLALGGAYGARKLYKMKKEQKEVDEETGLF